MRSGGSIFSASSYYVSVGACPKLPRIRTEDFLMNNCLCHLFDDNCTWIIIIALLILFCSCCH